MRTTWYLNVQVQMVSINYYLKYDHMRLLCCWVSHHDGKVVKTLIIKKDVLTFSIVLYFNKILSGYRHLKSLYNGYFLILEGVLFR